MGKKTPQGDRRRLIEEARRKERTAERRRTVLAVGGAVLAAAALVAGAVLLDSGDGKKTTKADERTAKLESVGLKSAADANCAEVETDDPISKDAKHKTGELKWPAIPPSGGDHNPSTFGAQVKNFFTRSDAVPPEKIVHNMEHGWVIAWYDKQVPDAEIELLKQAASSVRTQSRVTSKSFMVVPWQRDDFAGDRHIVLTAWGHRQRCGKVSGSVIRDFLTKYENKDAPEAGAPI